MANDYQTTFEVNDYGKGNGQRPPTEETYIVYT